ncbi:MAG: hypothetical protein AAGH99_06900 [Planctomycetota bacterium]
MLCLALTVVLLATAGCQSNSKVSQAEQARDAEMRFVLGPLVDADGTRRSLSLDSREMAELQELQPWLDDRTAWYHSRLDNRRGVDSGFLPPVFTIIEIKDRDKLNSSNGQVQDNFSRDVKREIFIESAY